MPSSTLVAPSPTPLPVLPTITAAADQSAIHGYDNGAGNCVDAAQQAISLITKAGNAAFGSTPFNMDMHLDLAPSDAQSGCDADGARLSHYRKSVVYSATLTVWSLDTAWLYAGSTVRSQWLVDVLNALVQLYPAAAIHIQVISSTNGAQCGSASIGFGAGQARAIDGTCS